MKNVLIPTDLTSQTLKHMDAVPQIFPKEKLNILLIHFIKMSDSITEMLLLSHRTREQRMITQGLRDHCEDIRRQHGSHIQSVNIDFFYGSTAAMFQDFIEANAVSAILFNSAYTYKKACKNSADPVRLIMRSGAPLYDVQKLQVKKAQDELLNTEMLIDTPFSLPVNQ
ncbi:MAG: hypothetical protein INR69_00605 [Mucilaginibacter polytrichastri]|nr:hypothetical protein [Mucilaginibacter polytrichastri]